MSQSKNLTDKIQFAKNSNGRLSYNPSNILRHGKIEPCRRQYLDVIRPECIERNDPIETIPLMFQSDLYSGSGAKEYWIMSIEDVTKYVLPGNGQYAYCYFYETFLTGIPVNLVIDLDIKSPNERDKIPIIYDEVFMCCRNLLRQIGYDITKEDVHSSYVPKEYYDKKVNPNLDLSLVNNAKLEQDSLHMTFRGKDFCFGDFNDLSFFMGLLKNKLFYECLDDSIYRHGGSLRLMYCIKMGDVRPLKPYDREIKTINEARDVFKKSLATFVTQEQLENFIIFKKPEIKQEPAIAFKPKNRDLDKGNVLSNQHKVEKVYIKLFDIFFGKNYKYRLYNNNNIIFLYHFTDDCFLCKKKHCRDDGSYLTIRSNLDSYIEIKFKCWNADDNRGIIYYIPRYNTKLGVYHWGFEVKDKAELLIRDEDVLLSVMCKMFNFMYAKDGYQEIKMDIPSDLTNLDVFGKVIKYEKDRIDPLEDVYYKAKEEKINDEIKFEEDSFDICQIIGNYEPFKYDAENERKQTITFIKAGQGSAKTERVSKMAKNAAERDNDFTFIGINPLRTLNATCKRELGDDFELYSNLDKGEMPLAPRLIITPDSLIYLRKEGRILKRSPDMVWFDEINTRIGYLNSSTLKDRRRRVIDLIKYYMKYAEHLYFTDSDLCDENVEIIKSIVGEERMKNSTLIYNTKKTRNNDYFIMSRHCDWIEGIEKKISEGKKIYIICDLKKNADARYTLLTQKYPDLKIFLITSEANNSIDVFINCNEIFVQYDVVIVSPAAGPGFSFTRDHFDCIFAHFTGLSVPGSNGNQMMNRVRSVREKKCYLNFNSVRRNHFPTNIKEMIDHINGNTQEYLKTVFDSNGNYELDLSDTCTKIFANNQVIINRSRNNFVSEFLKYVIRDGNNVYFKGLDWNKIKVLKEIKAIKELNMTINQITHDKAKRIIDAPLISYRIYRALLTKDDKTEQERDQMTKWFIFSKVNLNIDSNSSHEEKAYGEKVIDYFLRYNTIDKYDNLMSFLKDEYINQNEVPQFDSIKFSKYEAIKVMLKLSGFELVKYTRKKGEDKVNSVLNLDKFELYANDIDFEPFANDNCKEITTFIKNIRKLFKYVPNIRAKIIKQKHIVSILSGILRQEFGIKFEIKDKRRSFKKKQMRYKIAELKVDGLYLELINKNLFLSKRPLHKEKEVEEEEIEYVFVDDYFDKN